MSKSSEKFVVKGSELLGLSYEPLFPYFSDNENAFVVLDANFVTTEDGTGIVHLAPGFGEEDYSICSEVGIKTVCPVDESGSFTKDIYDIEYDLAGKETVFRACGRQVFETNDDVIKYLKGNDLWLHTESYIHQYPFCWRTDTPLIYKAVNSWYVKVTDIKDRMVELNQNINWVPSHVKDGVFGKWLENTRDWSISRNRFWGCPVPVWKSTDSKYPRVDVYGSIEELENDFSEHYEKVNGEKLKVIDLHRPFVDNLTRPNPDDPTGKSMMVRIEDVLDCWFESGSMPYASVHYPFEYKVGDKVVRNPEENQKWFKDHFPADFIVEYTAQTRGWFYTLMVLGTALFDSHPFKNCICHGVVLDDKSEKLSKRLQNYPDPMKMFDLYGSDAMRFAMCRSQVMKGGELNIDIAGNFVKDVARLILLSLWNAFSFLKSYMICDGIFDVKDKLDNLISYNSKNTMDLYILSKLHCLTNDVKKSLDAYDIPDACHAIESFIEAMNNWYIRRCKKRFWSSMKYYGDDCKRVVALKEDLSKRSKSDLVLLSERSIKNQSQGSNDWDYIESVISDIILTKEDYRFQYNESESSVSLIDHDKITAYKTLYTVMIDFCIIAAPLMPCLTEKIYLDLID